MTTLVTSRHYKGVTIKTVTSSSLFPCMSLFLFSLLQNTRNILFIPSCGHDCFASVCAWPAVSLCASIVLLPAWHIFLSFISDLSVPLQSAWQHNFCRNRALRTYIKQGTGRMVPLCKSPLQLLTP